jgi:heme A synthase
VKAIECPRESDVLDALASARWPHRVSGELADHVASCAICTDVLAVAAAMRTDQDAQWQHANIPSSGQVWWRAEMRARQEAIRKASRPITIAQGVAALLALALTGMAGWFAWTWLRYQAPPFGFASVSAQALTSPLALASVVALCALVVIAPVALYLVLSDE